ncbi:MAG: helix-turn-helix domain-containing protein [Planctomycetes bacterium]|nr:helix-turn-helix domain-containing protein [Planctomycetota bacterium]
MAQMKHVALLIETSRAYGRGLLRGVARYNREHGPWSIYLRPHGLGDPPPKWLRAWKGDGILARINDKRMAEAVKATRLPAIDLRGALDGLKLPYISVNNRSVAKLAFDHLIDRGFRRFGICGVQRGIDRAADRRCDEFIKLVEAAGLPCMSFEAKVGRTRPDAWEIEQEKIAEWIAELPKPIGVMACYDDRGQQVLDACRRINVAVPDDVAVISCDNDPILCGLATPPMTSIDISPDRIGYEAAALLDRIMEGEAPPKDPIYIEPGRVVTRQSTDVLAIDDRQVAAAVAFIRASACSGIGVADIVRSIGVSRSSLERRFKKLFGHSPKEHILKVQFDRARQLLTESDLPVASIASKIGFTYTKYFIEVFNKRLGCSPGVYRKKFRTWG